MPQQRLAHEVSQIDVGDGSVAWDVPAVDEMIGAHGAEMIHWMHLPDPSGLVDRYDVRRPGPHLPGASNGSVFVRAGVLVATVLGNTKALVRAGFVLDSGVAQCSPQRFYADDPSKRVHLHALDRLYFCEEALVVPRAQLGRAHETGQDRLDFPAVEVQALIGSDGVRYECGQDFEVSQGDIKWGRDRRPAPGTVYTIRYLYRPFWYVDRHLHEIRVAQTVSYSGERSLEEVNQSVVVKREYVALQEEQQSGADRDRGAPGPQDGGFGPK